MKECDYEFMQKIINHLCNAPATQLDERVAIQCQKFITENHTAAELFDFIVNISKSEYTQLSDTVVTGDASKFVIELCALDKYYLRPT